MEEKDSNGKFITRQQFCKIIDLFDIYRQKHNEVFPNKPLSNQFRKGLIKGPELIETYVVIKEKKTMTREQAKELLPIIQAWTEDKTIQVRINNDSSWTDLLDNDLKISNLYEYRIKPEPKYRPFKTKEECWNEMMKHQPFGWVKNKCGNIFNIIAIFKDSIKLNERDTYYSECCKQFKFIDGTPFGIKEE